MANGSVYQLDSVRQEHGAVFSVCQVLFHIIYNETIAGDMVYLLRRGFGFFVCAKSSGVLLKS